MWTTSLNDMVVIANVCNLVIEQVVYLPETTSTGKYLFQHA